MWLLVGLGNPGPRFLRTRHNFGWLVVSALAESQGLKFFEALSGKAMMAELPGKAYLLLPLTYMNLSGEAVLPAAQELSVSPERILVVHDDLDLPLGRLKLVPKGGAGGHRGVLSIISALGTEAFPRMKLGIGRPLRGVSVKDYVLSEFGPEEWPLAEKVIEVGVKAIEVIFSEGLEKAMTLYNRRDLIKN